MKKILALLLAAMMLLALVSCTNGNTNDPEGTSADAENTTEPSETDPAGTDPAETTESGEDDDFIFDIQEDDNTIIWAVDRVTYVYHHDGVNVTSYECFFEFETIEEAQSSVNTYQALLGSSDELKSVTRKGKYMVLSYNESAFPYSDYETLKIVSDAIKALGEEQ